MRIILRGKKADRIGRVEWIRPTEKQISFEFIVLEAKAKMAGLQPGSMAIESSRIKDHHPNVHC